MGDWTGENLKEAMAQKHTRPSFVPLQAYTNNQWGAKVIPSHLRMVLYLFFIRVA